MLSNMVVLHKPTKVTAIILVERHHQSIPSTNVLVYRPMYPNPHSHAKS